MLADLEMPGALEAVDGILARADGGAATAAESIEDLLAAQIALHNDRRLETAMRASRLPAAKTLAQFGFAFQPSVRREQIESPRELGFVERAENVVLLGPPPGVGKTHLAISLAIAAAESGRRVHYGTLADLVESLAEAKTAGNLARRLRVPTHPAVLVVDEIGCLPWSRDAAVLFFQLADARHECASTVLTSNNGFEERSAVLGDEATAIGCSTGFRAAATSIKPGQQLPAAGAPGTAVGRFRGCGRGGAAVTVFALRSLCKAHPLPATRRRPCRVTSSRCARPTKDV